ncbi:MAG: TPR repeat- and protein kinase domain-containing, partial [Planctomycetota bacterium]
ADAHAALGEVALAEGDLPEAAASFRNAMRASPRDGRARFALAWSAYWMATVEVALDVFLDGRPDTPRARSLRREASDALAGLDAQALSARDQFVTTVLFAAARGDEPALRDALANGVQVGEADPALSTLFLLRGALSLGSARTGPWAEAARRFRNDPIAGTLAGLSADISHHPDESLRDLEAAIRVAPRFGPAHAGRALCLRGTGKAAEARAAFTAAIDAWPSDAASMALRGVFFEDNGDLKAALADYDASLRIDPSRPSVFIRRGDLRAAAGEWSSALADFDAAAALHAGRAEIISRRAIALLRLEDWRAGLTAADEALALDIADSKAWIWRGVAHAGLNDDDAALADFTRATDLNPDSVDAWDRRTHTHFRLGQWKETLEAVKALGALRKLNVRMLWFRGASYRHLGNLPAAEADLRLGVQIDPRSMECWLELAELKEAKGDRKGRVEAAKKALQLAPADHPDREQAKRLAEDP